MFDRMSLCLVFIATFGLSTAQANTVVDFSCTEKDTKRVVASQIGVSQFASTGRAQGYKDGREYVVKADSGRRECTSKVTIYVQPKDTFNEERRIRAIYDWLVPAVEGATRHCNNRACLAEVEAKETRQRAAKEAKRSAQAERDAQDAARERASAAERDRRAAAAERNCKAMAQANWRALVASAQAKAKSDANSDRRYTVKFNNDEVFSHVYSNTYRLKGSFFMLNAFGTKVQKFYSCTVEPPCESADYCSWD